MTALGLLLIGSGLLLIGVAVALRLSWLAAKYEEASAGHEHS